MASTRDDVRPFNIEEQRRILQVGACLTCHDIQQKKIGPPFHAVAERYRNDPQAFAKLLYKVQHGGAGNWGNYPMPPNPQANPDDLKALVKWVLAQ